MSLSHVLGLQGPHLLVRTGELKWVDSDPYQAAAIFRRIRWDGSRFRLDGSTRHLVCLPLAHTIQLPLAAGLVDGVTCHVGSVELYKRVSVSVCAEIQNVKARYQLEAEGLLRRAGGAYSQEDREARVDKALYYQYRSRDPRFQRVFAPCSVIFTAYFSPSSQMGTTVLSNDFESLARGLRRSSAYTNPATGVSHLKLDRQHHVVDVPMIARALFDESGVAHQRTLDVGASLALCSRNNAPRCIRAVPPFNGETNMSVYGYVLQHGPIRTLVITQILECDHPFPVSRLEVELDQAGASNDQASAGGGTIRRTADDAGIELEVLDATGNNPSNLHPPVTALGRPGTTFKGLNRSNLSIERRECSRARKGARLVPINEDLRNSTQRRTSDGDASARQTHSSTRNTNDSGEDHLPPENRSLTSKEALKRTLDELDSMSITHEAQVVSRIFTDMKLQQRHWLFNVVRQEGTGRRPSWRMLEGGTPRGILIAQVSKSHAYAYVVEILRRGDDSFSTLMVSQPDCSEIDSEFLEKIFQVIDSHQKLPKDTVIRGDSKIEIRRIRHNAGQSENKLSQVLSQRLSDALQGPQ